MKNLSGGTRYLNSILPGNRAALEELQDKMVSYYTRLPYPDYAQEPNFHKQKDIQDIQRKMLRYIPSGARLLEVGCAWGTAAREIVTHRDARLYVGVNLIYPEPHENRPPFLIATAHALPFRSNVWDVVLSLFTIEHLVLPASFLDEAWRTLKPGGCLLIVAPDFTLHPMQSERIGLSYGAGREKLAQGKILDALLTAYDTRVRITLNRLWRRIYLCLGYYAFPILAEPRCLRLRGFTPDCDAVYPACPEEIFNYLRKERADWGFAEIFHRDSSSFGVAIRKQAHPKESSPL